MAQIWQTHSYILIRIYIYFNSNSYRYLTDNFSAISNPADDQNGSCLGLCGWDICPKSNASYGLGTFNPQLSVSI